MAVKFSSPTQILFRTQKSLDPAHHFVGNNQNVSFSTLVMISSVPTSGGLRNFWSQQQLVRHFKSLLSLETLKISKYLIGSCKSLK